MTVRNPKAGFQTYEPETPSVIPCVKKEPPDSNRVEGESVENTKRERENVMANAFWVSVRNNISKRWNTTENYVSKNQSSADSAIRLPNTF
ncbi:hypothetical protein TNCV_3933941 [Trichonephila clavipes]|nr:hypothetical protein TNCV_3933941 [Trichonephila clavipes]